MVVEDGGAVWGEGGKTKDEKKSKPHHLRIIEY